MRVIYSAALSAARSGPCKRPLLDHQEASEGNAETDRGGDEDPVKGQSQIALPCRQFIQRQRRRALGHSAEHDGAEHRDDDRAAKRAKEIQCAGRGAELMRLDGVLHDDRADRIHRSKSATKNEQEPYDFAECLSRRIDGENSKRQHGDDEAADRDAHVMAACAR